MIFTGTAHATDRALVIKNICSEDFSEQRSALANLVEAGALGNADTAIWAKTVVDSFEKRALRCSDTIAVICLLYTSPSPRDEQSSRMPSSA